MSHLLVEELLLFYLVVDLLAIPELFFEHFSTVFGWPFDLRLSHDVERYDSVLRL